MPISLYAATVPPMLQILGSVTRLVRKAEAHCAETGTPERDIIAARLAPDMLPFTYQVKSVGEHSIGAIDAVRAGYSTPSLAAPPPTFAGLFEKLEAAREGLATIDPAEMESFVGKDVVFEFKTLRRAFTAENFLLSYALPNFYFHAVTAYDVLRSQGFAIGKPDYLGELAVKL